MIGRVEVLEILGMAGTCALLLFAGFGVETLGVEAERPGATGIEVTAPDLPDVIEFPQEIHLELPRLERPARPAVPSVSLDVRLVPLRFCPSAGAAMSRDVLPVRRVV